MSKLDVAGGAAQPEKDIDRLDESQEMLPAPFTGASTVVGVSFLRGALRILPKITADDLEKQRDFTFALYGGARVADNLKTIYVDIGRVADVTASAQKQSPDSVESISDYLDQLRKETDKKERLVGFLISHVNLEYSGEMPAGLAEIKLDTKSTPTEEEAETIYEFYRRGDIRTDEPFVLVIVSRALSSNETMYESYRVIWNEPEGKCSMQHIATGVTFYEDTVAN